MTPEQIDRVFGRGRLKMTTGEHVDVYREAVAPGERRRYTKRFLDTGDADFGQWTEREWRILARLIGHGIRCVPDVVQFDSGSVGGIRLVQTYDAGVTVDQWATLLPVSRNGALRRHVFEDCAHWWALAHHCLAALEEIHRLSLVHLDIKGDNICIPFGPANFDPDAPDARLYPMFGRLALIDFAFSLVSRESLAVALPIGWQKDYDYQSPRLLSALEAGRAGDVEPTRELDWRCDFYSLAAMLKRYLPEEDGAYAADGAGGWSPTRYYDAKALIFRLRDAHDRDFPHWRPHQELMHATGAALREPDLAASLEYGWTLARDAVIDASPSPITPMTRIAPSLHATHVSPLTTRVVAPTAVTVVALPLPRSTRKRAASAAHAIALAIVALGTLAAPSHVGDPLHPLADDVRAFVDALRSRTEPKSPDTAIAQAPAAAPKAEPEQAASAPASEAASRAATADSNAHAHPDANAAKPEANAAKPEASASILPPQADTSASAQTAQAQPAMPQANVESPTTAATPPTPTGRAAAQRVSPPMRASPQPSTASAPKFPLPRATAPPMKQARAKPAPPAYAARQANARLPLAQSRPTPSSSHVAAVRTPTAVARFAPSPQPTLQAPAAVSTPAIAEVASVLPTPEANVESRAAATPKQVPNVPEAVDGTAPANPSPPPPTTPSMSAERTLPTPPPATARPAPPSTPPAVPRNAPSTPRNDDVRTQLSALWRVLRGRDQPAAPIEERIAQSSIGPAASPPHAPPPPPRIATTPPMTSSAAASPGVSTQSAPSTSGPRIAWSAPPAPVSSEEAPADVFGKQGQRVLSESVPRVAAQAQADIARVLWLAMNASLPSQESAVVYAARAKWPSESVPIVVSSVAPTYARRMHDDARHAFAAGGNVRGAIDAQLRALGADPHDANIAGYLAFLHLKTSPPQPEAARQLALYAMALRGAQRTARVEDWQTFAIASALAGRDAEARQAMYASMALASNLERTCVAALGAYGNYGERLRAPVEAMLYRIHVQHRAESPYCAWPPDWRAVSRLPE